MYLRTLYYVHCITLHVAGVCNYVSVSAFERTFVNTVCNLCWVVAVAVILEFTYVCTYVCFLMGDGV